MTIGQLIVLFYELDSDTEIGVMHDGIVGNDLLLLAGQIEDESIYFFASYRAVQDAGIDDDDGDATYSESRSNT